PNVRDDGQRPSQRGGMAGEIEVIWGRGEGECFCGRGWTGSITLIGLNKLHIICGVTVRTGKIAVRPSLPQSAMLRTSARSANLQAARSVRCPASDASP